ncbi:MAG TPA: hypothetical protein DDW36_04240 [Candidatus Magasanikbacteria bacterium]|nr:hypothetical protein [Candidatus Magasanikbacteria bacterium]
MRMLKKKIIKWFIAGCVCAVLLLAYLFYPHGGLQKNQIAFLDVGQGDATLIRYDDNTLMLVDCGPDASVLRALSRQLSSRERRIAYVVVTHTDRDHFGGCVDVLKQYDVGQVITSGRTADDAWWKTFEESIAQENAGPFVMSAPVVWQFASSSAFFLFPDRDIVRENIKKDNDTSVIMQIAGVREKILLTGDAELWLENYLLSRYASSTLRSSILKAGHHGSKSSTSLPFLNAVSPRVGVISAGKDNRYGHPHARTLIHFQQRGIEIRRTDQEGDIVFDF